MHPPREVQPNQAASEGLSCSSSSKWEDLLLDFVTKWGEAVLKKNQPVKRSEWLIRVSTVVPDSLQVQTRCPESALSLWSPPP